ncbi:MAG: hypothetical protein FWE25_07560 [Lachnospiraceae bacterium]|nr:hypothetical protein [Lachnospiraceae bacterium]
MKKIRKIVMIAMLVMVCSINTITLVAGNVDDTRFDFNFSPAMLAKTVVRAKRDDTSSYMKCFGTTVPYTAKVYAIRSLSDKKIVDVGSPSYTFGVGMTHFMHNYVKESGYGNALIGGMSAMPGTAYGFWSPDSV